MSPTATTPTVRPAPVVVPGSRRVNSSRERSWLSDNGAVPCSTSRGFAGRGGSDGSFGGTSAQSCAIVLPACPGDGFAGLFQYGPAGSHNRLKTRTAWLPGGIAMIAFVSNVEAVGQRPSARDVRVHEPLHPLLHRRVPVLHALAVDPARRLRVLDERVTVRPRHTRLVVRRRVVGLKEQLVGTPRGHPVLDAEESHVVLVLGRDREAVGIPTITGVTEVAFDGQFAIVVRPISAEVLEQDRNRSLLQPGRAAEDGDLRDRIGSSRLRRASSHVHDSPVGPRHHNHLDINRLLDIRVYLRVPRGRHTQMKNRGSTNVCANAAPDATNAATSPRIADRIMACFLSKNDRWFMNINANDAWRKLRHTAARTPSSAPGWWPRNRLRYRFESRPTIPRTCAHRLRWRCTREPVPIGDVNAVTRQVPRERLGPVFGPHHREIEDFGVGQVIPADDRPVVADAQRAAIVPVSGTAQTVDLTVTPHDGAVVPRGPDCPTITRPSAFTP